MRHYVVYMLRCADGSFYTGVTHSISKRLHEHESGRHSGCYTYRRRPLVLVYTAIFNDVHEAISWEKHIKRWTRDKKKALMKGDEVGLRISARRRRRYSRRSLCHGEGSAPDPS